MNPLRAYIAWMTPKVGTGYAVHVQGARYEMGPEGLDLAGAIGWARGRTTWIVVRPEWDPDNSYWAGDGESPVDPDGTSIPRLKL